MCLVPIHHPFIIVRVEQKQAISQSRKGHRLRRNGRMKLNTRFFRFLLPILLIFFLYSLLTRGNTSAQNDPIVFRTAFHGGDIPSIDQALVEEPYGIQLVDEMTVGLLRLNEETLELEPGIAESYTFNQDRTVVTFTLRDDIPWVRYNPDTDLVEEVRNCAGNVRKVTAFDFVYGGERTLRPETASPYAFLLNKVIAGATAYNDGSNPDFAAVGIRADDAHTLTVTLIGDRAYALNILSLWMFHAMPSWLIEGDDCTTPLGETWVETGAYQGYGPFTLKSWNHDAELTLIKNPFWRGTDAIPVSAIDQIEMRMISETNALAEFEAGNLDFAQIPFGDFDRIHQDPVFADALIEKPVNIGTEALLFNHLLPPTDDIRVRQALLYATDREAIVTALKSGTVAPFWIHPNVIGSPAETPGDATAETYGAVTDTEKARALLASYCDEKAIEPKDLTLTYFFSTSDQHKVRAEVIAAMWREALGINVVLENVDWGVFKDARKEGLKNVYRTAWIQDYLDANNFTADVFLCPAGYYQSSTDWPTVDCVSSDGADPLYDEYQALVERAARENDPVERRQLYARSEKILIRDAAIINPISYNNAFHLLNPRFQIPVTRTGYDRWEKWLVKEEKQ